jgi:DNA (cytosine-5)-methyltransferase 1
MRHGSLFSGIGGFDLASEWMGWENVFHCEWNPFGQKVLNYYWPNSITYNDITKTDFTIHRGGIDIITGGFPCQPYSSAGKRLGKEDERHLWPEMLRAIREIQPTWVVGENVRGLTNWNGGLVFDEVQAELEAQGYEVTPFLLPACSVNAPHRRDRIWFIAYSDNKRRSSGLGEVQKENGEVSKWDNNAESSNSNNGTSTNSNSIGSRERFGKTINSKRRESSQHISEGSKIRDEHQTISGTRVYSDSDGIGCNNRCDNWQERHICRDQGVAEKNQSEWNRRECGTSEIGYDVKYSDSIGQEWRSHKTNGETTIWDIFSKSNPRINKRNSWQNFPTQSPICNGDDGLSDRLDSITFSKWRQESIKAGGNAIVPQVVYQIFKAIEQYNQLDKQLSI